MGSSRRLVVQFGQGMALLLAILAVRVASIQLGLGTAAEQRWRSQTLRSVELPARRGDLRDRHGRLLATSVSELDLCCYWRNIQQSVVGGKWVDRSPEAVQTTIDTVVQTLGPHLAESPDELRRSLRALGWTQLTEPITDPDLIDLIESERGRKPDGKRGNLSRLDVSQRWRRELPWGSAGHNLLGWVSENGRGGGGLELGLDVLLTGADGARLVRWDGKREVHDLGTMDSLLEARDGCDVRLTLDARVQHDVEAVLVDTCAAHRAEAAVAVVLEPLTGDVLALASVPSLMPGKGASRLGPAARIGPAHLLYAPGSTFKPIMLATALDMGLVALDERIDTRGGRRHFGSRLVEDSSKSQAPIDLETVLVRSSNVAMASIMTRLAPGPRPRAEQMAPLREVLDSLGFGRATGTPIPGERGGILNDLKRWKRDSLVSLSFGYEVSVTALQMAAAIAALADGRYVPPRMVAAIDDGSGLVPVPYTPPQRIWRTSTTDHIRRWMTAVVADKHTRYPDIGVSGVAVAGKTGTAVIEHDHTREAHSFVALAPADRPRVAVVVMVFGPQDVRYANETAAPAASRILSRILPYLDVPVGDGGEN